MKTIYSELADDQEQNKVVITHQTLLKMEQLFKAVGLPEESLSPEVHHLLIGGFSYLHDAQISELDLKKIGLLVKSNIGIIKAFAHSLTKSLKGKPSDKETAGEVEDIEAIFSPYQLIYKDVDEYTSTYIFNIGRSSAKVVDDKTTQLCTKYKGAVVDVQVRTFDGMPALIIILNKLRLVK